MLNAIVMRRSHAQMHEINPHTQKNYKFYVEPSGNNHSMVRSVIKRRSWFSSQDVNTIDGWSGQGPKLLNLIWTQVRRPRVLKEMLHYQIYNHLDGINIIAQKSSLFQSMSNYYVSRFKNVSDYMPETYLVPA